MGNNYIVEIAKAGSGRYAVLPAARTIPIFKLRLFKTGTADGTHHLNTTAMKKKETLQQNSAENTPASDAEKDGLKGPVKQVMQVTYRAYLREGTPFAGKIITDYNTQVKNNIRTYSPQGQLTHRWDFTSYNSKLCTLNEKQQPLLTKEYNLKGELTHTITQTYTPNNQLLETINLNADGSLYYHVKHVYNENWQQLSHVHEMGPERRVIASSKHEYNQQGKPILHINYNAKGEISSVTRQIYNEAGQQIEHIHEQPNSTSEHSYTRYTQKYNEHGDCVEMTFYDREGNIKSHNTYHPQYDAEGKKIPPPPYIDHEELERKKHTTEQTETDHHGNWIKKVTFFDGAPQYYITRQFQYYGEESGQAPELRHPLLDTPKQERHNPQGYLQNPEKADAQWIAEQPNTTPDNFPAQRYYISRFAELPSVVNIQGPNIEALALLAELKEHFHAQVVHSYSTTWNGSRPRLVRYTLAFVGYPYLLQATGISSHNEEEYKVPERIFDLTHDYDHVYLSSFQLLRPGDASERRDEYFEDYLFDFIDRCSLRKKPDKPTIRTIEVKSGNFIMVEHSVNDRFEIRDLDVNYGQGFAEFHDELMKRFHSETTGLVLFHGRPGTGKTFYIRHLLRKMTSANRKVVIYMPPNMVDHLTDPAFMTFLTDEVKHYSRDGFFCVLLIEDAEPLLARRQEGVRIQGVTNLLNMSDGLLNDMLKLQIICTFNVDLKKLDSALLRPGRLLARKEFKPLSVLDANLLAQRLGIKHHFKKPATLAEVYSMRQNKNTLVHDTEPDQDTSTILDDLL